MDKEFTIELPKLGESIMNATVVQWFKKEGETIKLDEPLLEVSTDKVNSEIPSPVAGTVKKILANPDDELDVGGALCIIGSLEGSISPKPAEETTISRLKSCDSMKQFYSPVVLKIAQQEGISLDILKKIPPTGVGGRVTKRDLEAYLARKPQSEMATEQVKLSGMRKSIAENMVKSFYEAPHASLICEVDVSKLKTFIKKERDTFFQKHGVKLTITSYIAKAIAKATKEFPFINASLHEDTIYLKHFVNLGIAVSVDQGVMVPVINHCHQKDIVEIARNIAELSEKARSGTLAPEDVKDGSITMTNFGMSGTLIGIPIIRYPEVAIVGIGAIHKKVVALEDDSIAIRHRMYVSLTFDHRVLDGMYGCGFLNAVKKHIEEELI